MFKRANLDKQIDALPKEVKWCTQCVISNQRPRIIFDNEGVCSACRNRVKRQDIDWVVREKELQILLDQHRLGNGHWDVVVPSSGGKDSYKSMPCAERERLCWMCLCYLKPKVMRHVILLLS